MSLQAVTLQLPESIYKSARRTAQVVKRPLEEILVTVLRSSLPALDGLSPEIATELTALESLDNERLSQAAQSIFPPSQQRKLSALLRKNQTGKLTAREQGVLEALISEAERLMLRKYGVEIIGKTPCGRATVGALQLNRPLALHARRNWIAADLHPPKE